MNYRVRIGRRAITVADLDPVAQTAILNGKPIKFDFRHTRGNLYSLIVEDRVYPVHIETAGDGDELRIGRHCFRAIAESERSLALRKFQQPQAGETGAVAIRAPMPGLVVRLEVEAGDEVGPGQSLVVIEAMKMENELKSPVAGRVTGIYVKKQDAVEKEALLLKIATDSA